jgi:hypothetical protein
MLRLIGEGKSRIRPLNKSLEEIDGSYRKERGSRQRMIETLLSKQPYNHEMPENIRIT